MTAVSRTAEVALCKYLTPASTRALKPQDIAPLLFSVQCCTEVVLQLPYI